jgi:hypothetical protein
MPPTRTPLYFCAILVLLAGAAIATSGCGPTWAYRPVEYGGRLESGQPVGQHVSLGEGTEAGSSVTITVIDYAEMEPAKTPEHLRLHVRYDIVNNLDGPIAFAPTDSSVQPMLAGEFEKPAASAPALTPALDPPAVTVAPGAYRSVSVYYDAPPELDTDNLDQVLVRAPMTVGGRRRVVQARFVKSRPRDYPDYYRDPWGHWGPRSGAHVGVSVGGSF